MLKNILVSFYIFGVIGFWVSIINLLLIIKKHHQDIYKRLSLTGNEKTLWKVIKSSAELIFYSLIPIFNIMVAMILSSENARDFIIEKLREDE